jgi:tetratricopeptide (TPR) repeat protein
MPYGAGQSLLSVSSMPDPSGPRSLLRLPPVPEPLASKPLAVWRENVDIDTYEPLAPDRYPMFLETRVYQGSSGNAYPLPFHDAISQHKHPRSWDAIHLENEWLRLMVLPELGGRIHIGYDKSAGYDFFYRNNVIKPALVGLTGPWISGGVEFNWPQHHRPATYLPVDVEIEHHDDGAVTVWCSDHEPFHRMKGMHGITLYPDRALVELRVRLYNRSDDVRTFLWWANVAARVHDDYQSFFPTDVRVVADHARRATTGFPRATTRYYGIDYPSRVTADNPDADRIDLYRNIPVPTSYMCVDSRGDFFGGYDHAARAGFVHVADHRVSPGKKQWTWGNERFGWAWDRNLTDDDGPYVELMAGVYTDNQPDFSFLAPGETKTFRQYWYPIQEIGPVQQATTEVAVSLRVAEVVHIGVAVTRVRSALTVLLEDPAGTELWSVLVDLSPGTPLVEQVLLDGSAGVTLVVRDGDGELLRWTPPAPDGVVTPISPASAPLLPPDIASVEELFLTGVHLAQYRHATRAPEPYWEEALRRDPYHSSSATALASRAYEAAEFEVAEVLLRRAVARLTSLNPNPGDGEAHYRLGLTLLRSGQSDEAYDAFAKSAWLQAWRAPAYLAMARLCCTVGDWREALRLLEEALTLNSDHLAARDLRALVLRQLGVGSDTDVTRTLALDPLDWWARDLAGMRLTCDARTHLDVAVEYAAAGFLADALRIVDLAVPVAAAEEWRGTEPITHYHRADLLDRLGRPAEATQARRDASLSDATYCFPSGLDDQRVLRAALEADPDDARAAGLLGHWLYSVRRYAEAMELWRRAVELDPADAVCWRNLGVASHNIEHDAEAAMRCYLRAAAAAPDDGRLLYERDQLAKRVGEIPSVRLAHLLRRIDLVEARDDLTVELVGLHVQFGDAARGRELLAGKDFQPWEGGEGQVLGAWERLHLVLARQALRDGSARTAEQLLRSALDPPANLGEGPHLLANRADLVLALGDALSTQGRAVEAAQAWNDAATFVGDFQEMSPQPYSEKTYSSAQAWRRLGHDDRAEELLAGLEAYADDLASTPAMVDYFATSLPTLLLFADDQQGRREATALFLRAQAAAGRGFVAEAMTALGAVLERDPNHSAASDLLHELKGAGPGLDSPGQDVGMRTGTP